VGSKGIDLVFTNKNLYVFHKDHFHSTPCLFWKELPHLFADCKGRIIQFTFKIFTNPKITFFLPLTFRRTKMLLKADRRTSGYISTSKP